MNFLHSLVTAGTFLLVTAHPAQAIAPNGQSKPPSSIDTAGTIERGGTVNAIDLKERKLVVDGVTFVLTAAPVKITPPLNEQQGNNFQLKPGMQIRFTTSKENYSNQAQVREIWITSRAKNVSKQ